MSLWGCEDQTCSRWLRIMLFKSRILGKNFSSNSQLLLSIKWH